MSATLDSRQLLAFVTLARRGSFTQAAQELHLTQSAISHAMKALEQDVGLLLFDRVGKKVHLTQAGEQLLPTAEHILREMQDARAGMEQLQNWGHSRLRVGASLTACQYLLPTVLREFKQSFPRCALRIEAADGPAMCAFLRTNQIDLALMLEPPGQVEKDLAFRPLFTDELKLVVAPTHPWAQQGRVARAKLAAETFVLYNKNSYTFRMVSEYLAREEVVLSQVIELGSMEAIKELVKIGLGVGVLAPWVARKELAENSLVAFPLGTKKLRRTWGIAYLRGRQLPLAEETFVGLCEAVTQQLVEDNAEG